MKTKTRYIPSGFDLIMIDDSLGLEIYRDKAEPVAIAYSGKRSKHDFFVRFRDNDGLIKYVNDYIARLAKNKAFKEIRKAEKKQALKNLTVQIGDIFRASWGYEQTNIDYYQVISVKGLEVEVREIHQMRTQDGYLCGQCAPLIDSFKSDIIKKRLQVSGTTPYIAISSFEHAYLLDAIEVNGVKTYESSYWSSYA